jgi:hypothetical protein
MEGSWKPPGAACHLFVPRRTPSLAHSLPNLWTQGGDQRVTNQPLQDLAVQERKTGRTFGIPKYVFLLVAVSVSPMLLFAKDEV